MDMILTSTTLIVAVLVAALFLLGSPDIGSLNGTGGQARAGDQADAAALPASERLIAARKALDHAEKRVKHAQFVGEGVQAAFDALDKARAELEAAELAMRPAAGS